MIQVLNLIPFSNASANVDDDITDIVEYSENSYVDQTFIEALLATNPNTNNHASEITGVLVNKAISSENKVDQLKQINNDKQLGTAFTQVVGMYRCGNDFNKLGGSELFNEILANNEIKEGLTIQVKSPKIFPGDSDFTNMNFSYNGWVSVTNSFSGSTTKGSFISIATYTYNSTSKKCELNDGSFLYQRAKQNPNKPGSGEKSVWDILRE